MKRVLVTGAGGFAGSHLVDTLVAEGHEVIASLSPEAPTANLAHLGRSITRRRCDITKPGAVTKLISNVDPQWIFHLAAFASVGRSFANERLTYEVNLFGTMNIISAALQTKKMEKLVVIGSADSYGIFTPKTKLLTEDQPFNPISPYGASKAAMEYLANQYARDGRLPIVIARPFNHTGPRQSEVFALPNFCRQIAQIERGRKRPLLKVGDLSVKRDMNDVRDVVRGYLACAERGKIGRAYHFSCGKAVSLKFMLDTLLKMATKNITVEVDKSRLRKADIPVLRGDNSRARRELGYAPSLKLKDTLRDTLDYWRARES